MKTVSLLPFRWQTAKKIVRSVVLIVAIYTAAITTMIFQFPLFLWLTIEGVARYAPFWTSIPVYLYLGWQFDTVLQLPLGIGLVLLFAIRMMQSVIRIPKIPVVQVLIRTVVFFLFSVVMSRWFWDVNWPWIFVQTFIYSGALIVNLYRRQRV